MNWGNDEPLPDGREFYVLVWVVDKFSPATDHRVPVFRIALDGAAGNVKGWDVFVILKFDNKHFTKSKPLGEEFSLLHPIPRQIKAWNVFARNLKKIRETSVQAAVFGNV